jgi:hypothetical protein
LAAAPLSELAARFGKPALERARKLLEAGLPSSVHVDRREVELPSLSVSVRFPPGADESAILCTCKGTSPCIHAAPALLLLRGVRPTASAAPASEEAVESRRVAQHRLRKLLEEWIRVGLDGLSAGWHESAAALVIELRQSGLQEASDLLGSLRRQIRADVLGEGQVEPGRLRWLLAALWLRVSAAPALEGLANRRGRLPRETHDARFFSVLGANAWWGDRVFGLTLHLMEESTGQWLTVGTGRPVESKTSIASIAGGVALIGDYTARELLGRRLECTGCGFTAEGKLRLLEGGRCTLSPTSMDWPTLEREHSVRSLADVVGRLEMAAPELVEVRKPEVLLLAPADWGDAAFVVESQEFRWPMLLQDGAGLALVVHYRQERAAAIASLRRLAGQIRPLLVLGRLSASNRRPTVEPIALIWKEEGGFAMHQVDLDRWPKKERHADERSRSIVG